MSTSASIDEPAWTFPITDNGFQTESGERRILIVDDEPPIREMFAQHLSESLWMNLLANAAQAVAGDGDIEISTTVDGDSVVVAISDTGNGIPEAELSKIFDPFFSTKPVGEGTGLGLSISYGIIKRHGGLLA